MVSTSSDLRDVVLADKEITIDHIKSLLDTIANKLKMSNHYNLTDINVIAEDIFGQLLNLIHGYQLKSMSAHVTGNYAAVDLKDEVNGIAYQITTDYSREKIKHTLETFENRGLSATINRIYVLVLGNVDHTYRTPANQKLSNGQDFDYNKDVINFNGLLNDIYSRATSNPEILVKAYEILTMLPDSGRLEYQDIVKGTEDRTADEKITLIDQVIFKKGFGDICIRAIVPLTYEKSLSCCIDFRKHDISGPDIGIGEDELIRDFLVDEITFYNKHIIPYDEHMVTMKLHGLWFRINKHSAYNVYKCFNEIKQAYEEAMEKIYADLGCHGLKLKAGRFFVKRITSEQLDDIMSFSKRHNWYNENGDSEWDIFNDVCNRRKLILSPNTNSGKDGQVFAEFKFEPIISYRNIVEEYAVYWVPGSYSAAKSSMFDNITRWTGDYSVKWFDELLSKINNRDVSENQVHRKNSIWQKIKLLFER